MVILSLAYECLEQSERNEINVLYSFFRSLILFLLYLKLFWVLFEPKIN